MVADRQVCPVRQQRLGVGTEDPADVRRVFARGVEVDIVGDLERHVQLGVAQRDQVRTDGVSVGRVSEQRDDAISGRLPNGSARRHETVQRARREPPPIREQPSRGQLGQVEHELADRHPDSRKLPMPGEDPIGKIVHAEAAVVGHRDPGIAVHDP